MKGSTLIRFIKHWFSATSRYSVHSPFVYEFCTQVLPHKVSHKGKQVEALRKRLSHSTEKITFQDFGAGSLGKNAGLRESSVGKMAGLSARRYREGELLHRICNHYQPKQCLEFGTNLGISTLYQISALQNSQFITLEGSPELAQISEAHFKEWKVNPELLVGEFSTLLNEYLDLKTLQPDYVFVDGNHRYQATLDYFHLLLPHMAEGGIIVFDDINWSDGMLAAWKKIIQHPEVSISIDLFFMGICFIRRPQVKEDFVFRFV